MGVILAKFRKEKTTTEILEKLEDDIKEIEQYSVSTQAQQKRFVGNFLVISIGLYVIGFLVFYFAFFPPTWLERITYSVPMLIIPLLIFFIKRFVAWYFQRKLNKNSIKLKKLQAEKRKIIEKVMDTETYKVALEILNRFDGGPKPDLKSLSSIVPRTKTLSQTPPKLQQQQQQQQSIAAYRASAGLTPYQQQKSGTLTINPAFSTPPKRGSNIFNNNSFDSSFSSTGAGPSSTMLAQRTPNRQIQTIRKRTPFPIIDQRGKGVLEKMVDYLIGDGPHNRLAMICKECFGHNGMALPEEYEYTAFRCAYCGAMNPSRKLRPVAPQLLMTTPKHGLSAITASGDKRRRDDSSSSSTSTSERDSGPDSDENEQQPTKIDDIQSETTENIEAETATNTDAATAAEENLTRESSTEKLEEEKKND